MAGIAAPLLQQTLARLAVAARRLGLSDHDWALAAGIRPETLCRLRKRQDCDLATLVKIAGAVRCTLALEARIQGEALVSKDGLMPGRVSIGEERMLVELAWREAFYRRSPERARAAWTALGPSFFMAGVAFVSAQALPAGRDRLRALAEHLHPGIAVAKVFARWVAASPLSPAHLLRAIVSIAPDLAASAEREAEPARQTAATPAARPSAPPEAGHATSTPAGAPPAAPPREAGFQTKNDAAAFMRRFVDKLQRQGWTVRTEVPQSYVNDRGRTVEGRIDVVAQKNERTVAYELDRAGAREKSIVKLRAYRAATEAYVVCRNGRALRVDRGGELQQRGRVAGADTRGGAERGRRAGAGATPHAAAPALAIAPAVARAWERAAPSGGPGRGLRRAGGSSRARTPGAKRR